MSDSPLASAVLFSPHHAPRGHAVDTITIHHAACVGATAEEIARLFLNKNRRASSNYCVGADGSVALSVPEDRRAMTSSNAANDDRAVTIEVANSGGAPDWPVSEAAMDALVALCADVCRRNGIEQLRWRGDPTLVGQTDKQNMTVHRWFAATACPGDYLYNKMGDVAAAVNRRLAPEKPARVQTLAQAPEWAREELRRLLECGALQGRGGADENGLPAGLDLSEDMIRLLVVMERMRTMENG